MKIFKNKKKLIDEIFRHANVAFIPTMGSIHKGHLSLIKKAKKKSKNVLVSIYINPKQFNSSLDYEKYPRSISKDIDLLKKTGVKYLYLPTDKDIYSFKTKKPIYLDKFSKRLCGKLRPGHFKGVVNVINRFIEIIKPYSIFLGAKDFQQLTLIKIHIYKNKIPVKVISCPTIREKNGAASSSRNYNLSNDQINIVGHVYKYLKKIKSEIFLIKSKKMKFKIINKLTSLGVNKLEYLEFLNTKTLKRAKKATEKYNIFYAYRIGNVRLIDNL